MDLTKVLEQGKKIAKIAGGIVIGLIMLLLLIRMFTPDPFYHDSAKQQVKELQKPIDSLNLQMKFIISRLFELEQSGIETKDAITKVHESQDQVLKETQKIRRIYNEKIISVDKYTISQLDSFYRSRYNY